MRSDKDPRFLRAARERHREKDKERERKKERGRGGKENDGEAASETLEARGLLVFVEVCACACALREGEISRSYRASAISRLTALCRTDPLSLSTLPIVHVLLVWTRGIYISLYFVGKNLNRNYLNGQFLHSIAIKEGIPHKLYWIIILPVNDICYKLNSPHSLKA